MNGSVETAETEVWICQTCQENSTLVTPSTFVDETTPDLAAVLFWTGNR